MYGVFEIPALAFSWVDQTMAVNRGCCQLRERQTFLTLHHLIPRKLHRRNWFRKHYTRDELQRVVALCRDCHRGLHKLYDEMKLGKSYNSLDKLRADEAVMKHVQWVARRRVADVTAKQ